MILEKALRTSASCISCAIASRRLRKTSSVIGSMASLRMGKVYDDAAVCTPPGPLSRMDDQRRVRLFNDGWTGNLMPNAELPAIIDRRPDVAIVEISPAMR